MQYILFDDHQCEQLFPFTLTRPAAELRCGILKLSEKWSLRLQSAMSFHTQIHLSEKFSIQLGDDNLFINGRLFPNAEVLKACLGLQDSEALYNEDTLLAFRAKDFESNTTCEKINFTGTYSMLCHVHNLFTYNHREIAADFELICAGRSSAPVSKSNTLIGTHPVFIEAGAKVEASVLNSSEGPIYIGKNAEVMEGALIRGPFALCEYGTVKMGAKIYSGCTIGPYSKVGGELNNSILFAYSNKGHDGFLGNSVIGEWCNIGADSNNSNLKNNYEIVKLWNYGSKRFEKTGLQFCGLFMGDHSKCGINTMFNTGTIVGVSANIFGSGFPRNFVPSFSWGGAQGFETYQPAKAFKTAELVMQRRDIKLTEADKNILNYVYTLESSFRHWEKS